MSVGTISHVSLARKPLAYAIAMANLYIDDWDDI
tara:strand:+ start:812 stop:913 length:102 start_codon:yes stop_codon:yes gene_type:complete